jgi:hypothetical protein
MTHANAMRLADQTIQQLRKHMWTLCVWLSRQGDIVRTPNTDKDVAEAIMEAAKPDMENLEDLPCDM